jgi:hypothetical protein
MMIAGFEIGMRAILTAILLHTFFCSGTLKVS